MIPGYANAWRAADGTLRELAYPYRLMAEADAIPLTPRPWSREDVAEADEIGRRAQDDRRGRAG